MSEEKKRVGIGWSFLLGMLVVPLGVSLAAYLYALCEDILTYAVGEERIDERVALKWGVTALGGALRFACFVFIIEIFF